MYLSEDILRPARIVWEYLRFSHDLKPSDYIIGLGSSESLVAEWATALFLEGLAPYIIFSGNVGRKTEGLYGKPEAEYYADRAIALGVPKDKILIENRSTNTGDNVRFTRQLLESRGIYPKQIISVQKPYMERRAYATFKHIWPEIEVLVSSQKVTLDEYLMRWEKPEEVLDLMVGDMQRMKVYPERGYQAYQEIPEKVWGAFEELVGLGFDRSLV